MKMKKILFSAVSALAVAAAFAEGVASTEFGVLKVPSSVQKTIVSVPWLKSDTGSSSVCVSDMVLTAGLCAGDLLKVYRPSTGKYDSWVLAEKEGVLYWASVNQQGDGYSGNSESPDTATVDRGGAFILDRCGKPSSGPRVLTGGFCIMGKPASLSQSEKVLDLAGGTSSAPVYTLIAPPVVTDANANDFKWSGLKAGKDNLLVCGLDGTIKSYLWSGKQWKDSAGGNTATIKAGTGVWFMSKDNTGDKSVQWAE